MSQIEFVAPIGLTIAVSLRDPTAYTLLASGLTCSSPTPGVYRCNTASSTGVVYVEMMVGTARIGAGYAHLSFPGPNGYSALFDTLDEAAALDASAQADTQAIASEVYSQLAGGRSTLLSGPVPVGTPLDQVKTADLSYTIPITVPATSELFWFMRCHPEASSAYLVASKTAGLTQLMTNTSPTNNLASITRNAENVAVKIKAAALSQLPSETVACELRERTNTGDEISRHEVQITLRHSAGRN